MRIVEHVLLNDSTDAGITGHNFELHLSAAKERSALSFESLSGSLSTMPLLSSRPERRPDARLLFQCDSEPVCALLMQCYTDARSALRSLLACQAAHG